MSIQLQTLEEVLLKRDLFEVIDGERAVKLMLSVIDEMFSILKYGMFDGDAVSLSQTDDSQ